MTIFYFIGGAIKRLSISLGHVVWAVVPVPGWLLYQHLLRFGVPSNLVLRSRVLAYVITRALPTNPKHLRRVYDLIRQYNPVDPPEPSPFISSHITWFNTSPQATAQLFAWSLADHFYMLPHLIVRNACEHFVSDRPEQQGVVRDLLEQSLNFLTKLPPKGKLGQTVQQYSVNYYWDTGGPHVLNLLSDLMTLCNLPDDAFVIKGLSDIDVINRNLVLSEPHTRSLDKGLAWVRAFLRQHHLRQVVSIPQDVCRPLPVM